MKIIIVIPELSYRGGERIFYALAKGLVRSGKEVTIVAGRVTKNAFKVKSPIRLVSTHPLMNRLVQNNLLFLLFIFPILFYLIFKNAKDVDIIDSESGFSLWVSVLVGKILKKKVIWTIFAFETKPFEGNFLNRVFNRTFRKIDRFFATKADGFKSISPRGARTAAWAYGIDTVEVIIPAVDWDRFRNVKGPSLHDAKQPTLLLPAVLHSKKNQELAIYALTTILKKFPTTKLFFVGDGSDKDRLLGIASKKRVDDHVIFAGIVQGSEMAKYYQMADVVLVCSKVENEGLSMTALEALANKRMPIVSKGAGVAEILEEKNVGMVYKPTPEELSATVIKYLLHPDSYVERVNRGYEWVRKELTYEAFAKKTIQFYSSTQVNQRLSH